MGWRRGEVWFDTDVLWFREQEPMGGLALAGSAGALRVPEPGPLAPVATGLEASRRRRAAAAAARRRKRTTRTVPAVALVVGSASMLSISALRGGGQAAAGLQEDPPSLTARSEGAGTQRPKVAATQAPGPTPAQRPSAGASSAARVEWNTARSVGLPYSGRLVDGTQLPVEGTDWVTWNPSKDSSPNLPSRLYGNERTIRAVLAVVRSYREAHPRAPRVVVGDISRRGGGWLDEHVSHQNGLDVDVYYPRRDGQLRAPTASSQVDRRLAQDLLDRFLAAGAQVVFVGYSSGLRGPSGIVVPYPNHENHMHVRFPAPRG
jgi:Penicillin-insensitive murein endopeptidase